MLPPMKPKGSTLFLQQPARNPEPGGPAALVFIAPPGPMLGKRFDLRGGTLTIGRLDELEIPCTADGVSRRHAQLRCQPDGSWAVADLGSTNGTYVNDERVAGERVLREGDQVQIGTATAKFLSASNAEAAYHDEVYRRTVMDALTGVHNKRFFLEFLANKLAQRGASPLSLVMFDVDHFKKVNDVHGHVAGDAVLREVGQRLRPLVRPADLLARYGGEEFGLVLTGTPLAQAAAYAEQVRTVLAATPFPCSDTLHLPVTVSLGVAEAAPGASSDATELVRRADEHLYAAKRGGRNRVVAG
jgi:diguanylate cyclase (GGDEF)-like protein